MTAQDNQDTTDATNEKLQQNLKGAKYPAHRDHLIDTAKNNHAPTDVVVFLERMPADQTIETPEELTELFIFEESDNEL